MEVETIFENLLQDMTAVRDTVGDGCEMVIAMSAKVAGKLDLAKGGSHILESGTFQQGSVELKVKELDGCPIIRVPSARFQDVYKRQAFISIMRTGVDCGRREGILYTMTETGRCRNICSITA